MSNPLNDHTLTFCSPWAEHGILGNVGNQPLVQKCHLERRERRRLKQLRGLSVKFQADQVMNESLTSSFAPNLSDDL